MNNKSMKKAFITGIGGQDGYFLSKLLLDKGYEVHGLVRRKSQKNLGNLDSLPQKTLDKIIIHWGNVIDHSFIDKTIKDNQFDEIYHLAAQSFVAYSFENPKETYDINIGGTLNIVNAVKEYSPKSKLYFAATSELYGKTDSETQDENTPFHPRSPYGVSKLAGFWTIKNYRESYGLFMSSGILFNHESEYRGEEFVTRKITKAIADIIKGEEKKVELGNLNSKRDWGYAGEYVEAMWGMLQYHQASDFVVATGEVHSIREFVETAFSVGGIDVVWEGSGISEVGKNKKTGEVIVSVSSKFYRPAEVDYLKGDAKKAKKELDWAPKVKFDELVSKMMKYELNK